MASSLQLLPYPKGWLKRFFRLPILLFRLGLSVTLDRVPIMILTTRGRRTGQARFAALEYRQHGTKVYVISGWGERPQWYQNLQHDPESTVALGQKTYRAKATVIDNPSEKARALYMFRNRIKFLSNPYLTPLDEALNRSLREMQHLARQYTVIKFDLQDGAPDLPTVQPDLVWVWPLAALFTAFVAYLNANRTTRKRAPHA